MLPAVCALLLLWPRDAHAYLDPGTGSMIFQAVAAGVITAMFTIKTYWFRIKAFFSRKDASAEKGEEKKD